MPFINTWRPGNLIVSPYSKNDMDDILNTIITLHFNQSFPNHPEKLAALQAIMWRNYNETFRDMLIVWLNIYEELHH